MVIFLRDHSTWRYRLFDLMNETTASYVLGIPNSLQYIKKNFLVYVNIIKRKREEQKSERNILCCDFLFSPFVRMRPLGKGESSLLLAIGFCFLCKTLFLTTVVESNVDSNTIWRDVCFAAFCPI